MRDNTTIRLTITSDVRRALDAAKKRYPALSDPEILKLGLSKVVTESDSRFDFEHDRNEIRKGASYAVGAAYLHDADEDAYTAETGTEVHFS